MDKAMTLVDKYTLVLIKLFSSNTGLLSGEGSYLSPAGFVLLPLDLHNLSLLHSAEAQVDHLLHPHPLHHHALGKAHLFTQPL